MASSDPPKNRSDSGLQLRKTATQPKLGDSDGGFQSPPNKNYKKRVFQSPSDSMTEDKKNEGILAKIPPVTHVRCKIDVGQPIRALKTLIPTVATLPPKEERSLVDRLQLFNQNRMKIKVQMEVKTRLQSTAMAIQASRKALRKRELSPDIIDLPRLSRRVEITKQEPSSETGKDAKVWPSVRERTNRELDNRRRDVNCVVETKFPSLTLPEANSLNPTPKRILRSNTKMNADLAVFVQLKI